jgi:transcriptional regulator with XRE-family HTH domain
MSMSFTLLPESEDNQYFQAVWSRVFGAFIQSAREKAGMTVEQAARLTGTDAQRWREIEAGTWLPATRQQFHVMAAALDMEWATMARMVLMCRQAWGVQ